MRKSKNAFIKITKGILKMKRLFAILMAMCITVTLAACTEETVQPQKEINSDVSDTASEKSTDETFAINETAVFKNLKVTATQIEESNGTKFFEPESGKVFVGVNFTIENTSDETQHLSSLLLFDAYVDDVKCDYSISANVAFGDGTLDSELSPGKKLVGWYSVEVPEQWQQIELEVKSNWLSGNKARFVFNK